MDYEKKYKEFFEKAQKELQTCGSTDCDAAKQIFRFFPELKESEDEKIRKEIIEYIKTGTYHKSWLAWLEKQGKQNKPKFHEGDWITNGDYTWKIVEVKPLDYILQSQDGNIVDDTISHVDEQFHLWTINDAKDGDILATSAGAFIYNGNRSGSCPGCYCGINTLGKFQIGVKTHWTGKPVFPATKEQRDILFSKMKEADYEWDDEKKVLKKIDQKPYSQRKECLDCQFNYSGECKGFCAMKRSEQKPQRMVSAEAKEALYDKPTDEEMKELLRTEYEKGRADTIAEMEKDWSEEDERGWTNTMIMIKEVASNHYTKDSIKLVIDWLESTKNRVHPKQKWSIEDEKVIAIINNALTESNTPPDDYDKVYDWLESLRKRIGG